MATRDIIAWSAGVEKAAFLADRRTRSALERQLEILGEATKRLTPAFRDEHSHLPWRQMAGLRDVLIHRYDDVDAELLWETVTVAVPALLPNLESLLPAGSGNEG